MSNYDNIFESQVSILRKRISKIEAENKQLKQELHELKNPPLLSVLSGFKIIMTPFIPENEMWIHPVRK